MIFQTTEDLELRGVELRKGKTRDYIVIRVEDINGKSCEYISYDTTIAENLNKGELVILTVDFNPTYRSVTVKAITKIFE